MEIKGDRSGFTVICCDNGHIFPLYGTEFLLSPRSHSPVHDQITMEIE